MEMISANESILKRTTNEGIPRCVNVSANSALTLLMGSLSSLERNSLETVVENASKWENKLKDAIEELTERGQELALIDLLNLDNLADENVFTDKISDIIGDIRVLSEMARFPKVFDYDVPADLKSLAKSRFLFKECLLTTTIYNLIKDFIASVKDGNPDTPSVHFLEYAIKDLLHHRIPIEEFCDIMKKDKGTGTVAELQARYGDSYEEYIENKIDYIIKRISMDILSNTIINFKGIAKFKQELLEVCRPNKRDELASIMEKTDPNELDKEHFVYTVFSGGFLKMSPPLPGSNPSQQYLNDYEQMARHVSSIFMRFTEANTLRKIETGNGQPPQRVTNSVNLPEIVYHGFILASAEIWDKRVEEADFSEHTQYILDMMFEAYEKLAADYNLDNATLGEHTMTRILSTVSIAAPLMVSRGVLSLFASTDYMRATQSIGGICQHILHEKEKAKIDAELKEKGKAVPEDQPKKEA